MNLNHHNDDDAEMNVSLAQNVETGSHSSDEDRGHLYLSAEEDLQSGQLPAPPNKLIFHSLGKGALSAAPTLAFIAFGSGQTTMLLLYWIFLLSTTIPSYFLQHKGGVLRWFVGFFVLMILPAFKSTVLLAHIQNFAIKAVLYAVTALWECSNAVVIIGGEALHHRFGIQDLNSAILYSCAPCQVYFVTGTATTDKPPSRRRSIHIGLCLVGLLAIYFVLDYFESLRNFITSVVVLELEFLALMSSLMVVLLDLPSHLWQCIYDAIPYPPSSPRVVLPYGWIYSAKSTREFWSRWSRPATQLIRHLLYYPLGGKDRWYLSIPIMFGLNATSHYDLSFSLVGDRAEVWWNLVFGTLALVAMVEVVGDSFFAANSGTNNRNGTATTLTPPRWYAWGRVVLVHISLRVVLYLMVHKCLKTSLSNLWER